MPKARKRKAPVTAPASSIKASSSNPSSTRTVIRRFHVLIKQKAQLQRALEHNDKSFGTQVGIREELDSIDEEITSMGGLEAYQRMSSIGQGNDRGGGSEKVLIEWLNELGEPQRLQNTGDRYKLLEVGALKPDNYASCSSWIENTPIDLHSRHPSIKEQNFLLLDQDENRGKWDIVSLSLVVNFVPEPKDRGRMLRLANAMLRPGGYLFLALPLPCILNSRYLTPEHLHALMESISFHQIQSRWKEGGKMAYWLYKKSASPSHLGTTTPYEKKVVLRQGNRNNFSVLL